MNIEELREPFLYSQEEIKLRKEVDLKSYQERKDKAAEARKYKSTEPKDKNAD
jgi:hypothetical protein